MVNGCGHPRSRTHGPARRQSPGQAAGGSLSEHLHQHVVPRWTGDANFMPVVAHTKPLIQTLAATREDIARAWPRD